ncbi:hypothetical protein AB4Z27_15730 [Cupriavidus sp. KB_39]|jgi:hypothetical protein|uniref:hypothetical protein n=1 Tax=Cupriavidus sp. KB_39 TaxID=3233036 RepID=UPI003F90512A
MQMQEQEKLVDAQRSDALPKKRLSHFGDAGLLSDVASSPDCPKATVSSHMSIA